MSKTTSKIGLKCHYCGNDCKETIILFEDKYLCSDTCKYHFEKSQASLTLEKSACSCNSNNTSGIKNIVNVDPIKFNFLDDIEIQKKIISQNRNYNGKNVSSVSLLIPGIHCTSCVGMKLLGYYQIQDMKLR